MLCYCSRKSQNLALIRNISVVSNLEQQIICPRKNPAIPVLLRRTPAIFLMSYITWQFLLAGRLLLRLFRCEMEKRRGVFPFWETNFSFSGKQSGLPIRVICIIISLSRRFTLIWIFLLRAISVLSLFLFCFQFWLEVGLSVSGNPHFLSKGIRWNVGGEPVVMLPI